MAFTGNGRTLWVVSPEPKLQRLDGETLQVLSTQGLSGELPAPHMAPDHHWAEVEGLGVDPSSRYLVINVQYATERETFRRLLEVRDAQSGQLLNKDLAAWPSPWATWVAVRAKPQAPSSCLARTPSSWSILG